MGQGWGGKEVPVPAWVWITAKPFVIFSLILFKWHSASAPACQRWWPLKIHRRALSLCSLHLSASVSCWQEGTGEGEKNSFAHCCFDSRQHKSLQALWMRAPINLMEALVWMNKRPVSQIEDPHGYLGAMNMRVPTRELRCVDLIPCGIKETPN